MRLAVFILLVSLSLASPPGPYEDDVHQRKTRSPFPPIGSDAEACKTETLSETTVEGFTRERRNVPRSYVRPVGPCKRHVTQENSPNSSNTSNSSNFSNLKNSSNTSNFSNFSNLKNSSNTSNFSNFSNLKNSSNTSNFSNLKNSSNSSIFSNSKNSSNISNHSNSSNFSNAKNSSKSSNFSNSLKLSNAASSLDNSRKFDGIINRLRQIVEWKIDQDNGTGRNKTASSKFDSNITTEVAGASKVAGNGNQGQGGKLDRASEDEEERRGEVLFTKLSRNGGVENNLSRKEEVARRSEVSRDDSSPKEETNHERANGSDNDPTTKQEIGNRNESESSRIEEVAGRNDEQKLAEVILIEKKSDPSKSGELSRTLPETVSDSEGGLEKQPLTGKNRSVESRSEEDDWLSREEDIVEAENFGLQAMHELYHVKEPKLYSMGLYLEMDNPARYVAAFNDQTEEARGLARYGFAVLEGAAQFVKKYPDLKGATLSRSTRRTPLQQQCPRRGTPQCPSASLRYRTSDGSCNNLQNLWWGSAMSTMQRFLPPVYEDGVQSIRRSKNGQPLPSARQISSLVHEDRDVPLASVTHMLMQWGQFVDHDVTATGQSRGFNGTVPQCCLDAGAGFQPPEFMHPECLPIAVSLRDSFFGPLGVRCLEFVRSGAAPREDCEFAPREQLSQVTSYLDASTVYSSNALQSDSLRIFRNGLLQYGRIQSRRPLLPRQESDLCKRGSLSTSCFRAGDGRLSEQPALTSLHVVFLRLHNRVATQLASLNPHWSDEKLFQESRRVVGAVVQHVTYREYLPIILGHEVMKIFDLEILKKGYYDGYDPSVNPTIANSFSTAAYRFGHSLVQHSFVRFDGNHVPLSNNVSIHDEFSNPVNLQTPGSVDRLLLGLVNQPSQKRDEYITEELTNHLFQTPSFPFGMDLASLNIQRGRDHGLPPYVKWREPCGLSPVKTFDDLERVTSASAARKFRTLYSSVEDVDLYPAGLAERSVSGGLVGPTFACIIAQQFSNLRRGDRFWYENGKSETSFTPGQLQQIRRTTLAQILCKTMDNIETIQPFVFLLPDTLKNRRVSCDDEAIGNLDLDSWAEGEAEFRSSSEISQEKSRRPESKAKPAPVSSTKINVSNSGSSGGSKTKGAGSSGGVGTSSKGSGSEIRNDMEDSKFLLPQRQKPLKANIHQHNRIVVKRPFGPRDNLTIVVQNNAVNSPVFVNDAIYGTNIRIREPATSKTRPTSTHRPTGLDNAQSSGWQDLPVHRPPGRPIPTAVPMKTPNSGYPYVPQAFEDPSNPNPPNYGYSSFKPEPSNVLFDSPSGSSPRPTLYTYYTNVEQRPSTQAPNHHIDGYLINYESNAHGQNQARPVEPVYERPMPAPGSWSNSRPGYTANHEYDSTRPGGGSFNSKPDKYVYGSAFNDRPGSGGFTGKPDKNEYGSGFNGRPSGDDYNGNFDSRPNKHQYDGWNKPSSQHDDSTSWKNPSYHTKLTVKPSNRPHEDDFDIYQKIVNRPANEDNYKPQSNQESYTYSYNRRPITVSIGNGADRGTTVSSYESKPNRPSSYAVTEFSNSPYPKRPTSKPSLSIDSFPSYQVPTKKPFQSGSDDRPDSVPYKKVPTSRPSPSYHGRPANGDLENSPDPFSYSSSKPTTPYPDRLQSKPTYSVSEVWSDNTDNLDRPANLYHNRPANDNGHSRPQQPTYQDHSTSRPTASYAKGPGKRPPAHSEPENWSNSPSYDGVASTKPTEIDNWSEVPTYLQGPPGKLVQTVSYKPPVSSYTSRPLEKSSPDAPLSHAYELMPTASSFPKPFDWPPPPEPTISSYQSHVTIVTPRPKPAKVQSVTILTESVETVRQPGTSGYWPQNKVREDIPMPIASQKGDKSSEAGRRPGQYYYEKNVLHRYPDATSYQFGKNNERVDGHENDHVDDHENERVEERLDDRTNDRTYATGDQVDVLHRYPDTTNYQSSKTNERVDGHKNDHLDDHLDDHIGERVDDRTNDRTYATGDQVDVLHRYPDTTNYQSSKTNERVDGHKDDHLDDHVGDRVDERLDDRTNDRTYTTGDQVDVLHRYPDTTNYQSSKTNERVDGHKNDHLDDDRRLTIAYDEDRSGETNFTDNDAVAHVVRTDNRFVTTPTIVLGGEERGQQDYDLEGAFSEETGTFARPPIANSTNHWLNPEEDSHLTSMLEMPTTVDESSPTVVELPKPMDLKKDNS